MICVGGPFDGEDFETFGEHNDCIVLSFWDGNAYTEHVYSRGDDCWIYEGTA